LNHQPEQTLDSEVVLDDKPTGILYNRAYSIIDTIEIVQRNHQGKKLKLLKIRSPWGKEWNGPFSNNSEELIKNIKQINQKAV